MTGLTGFTPRPPSCHHEECHKSYRTLLKVANRLGGVASHTTQDVLSSHYAHADTGHLTSHAHNPNATNHARVAHRHHPYEIPPVVHQPGRRSPPVDMTPSPISTDDSPELPPFPHQAPTSAAVDGEYFTPSTSPFLHAIRNMNVGRSRTSSRVQSRATSPVPLNLPPAVITVSAGLHDTARSTIGRGDHQHRSHRSHPTLHSPQDGPSEHHHPYPYPHSHGGTPPGTPAPLTMVGRPKRPSTGGANHPSKHSIDALLSGGRREPFSADGSPHHAMDGTVAATPSLSSSSNSSGSGKPRHFDPVATDTTMSEKVAYNPPLSFPPPPSRSRVSGDLVSPVRSPTGSPEASFATHSALGLPSTSSSTLGLLPRNAGPSLSSPSTPNPSHSHLAHSVRVAFGMTPIHPPNYFSTRGRSTIGFGNSSVRGSARSQSPPITLPPLKLGARTEESSSRGSEDGRESEYGHGDVRLPHLDSLASLVGGRGAFRTPDDMDVDDLC